MATPALYTCAAITEWANTIFRTSHESLIQFQPKDVALLLYGILKAHATLVQSEHPPTEDFSALLSCCSLQEIQFQANPSATTQLRNAEHVLSVVRRVSSGLAARGAFPSSSSSSSSAPSSSPSSASRAFGVIGETLTAEVWLDGRAFVEELKLWRWLREIAVRLDSTVVGIQHAVQAYLGAACTSVLGEKSGAPSRPFEAIEGDFNSVKNAAEGAKETREGVEKTVKLLPAAKKFRLEGETAIDSGAADGDRRGDLFLKLKEALGIAKANPPGGEGANLDKRTEVVCSTCPLIFAQALQGNLEYLKTLESQRRAALAACGKKNITELLAILSSFA
ncbi:unnamed protein product [Phytomonas sp. EM1]|nr:unnamed protein product [Phytomonas sp. EM1]|eukprot:CCW60215.1 unnamed protein product [Phytomonas sp. isolate EM1]